MELVLILFLLIFVGSPIANAVGKRIARGGGALDQGQAEALRTRLSETEGRLLSTEERLASVEERLEFYERLLANPDNRARIKAARGLD